MNSQLQDKSQKLRTLSVHGGTKQTSLRLDSITWTAIDYLASRDGIRWQDWATRVIDANYETNNMAGELRQAVIQQLMGINGENSGEVLLPEYHAILGTSYKQLDDAGVDEALKRAVILHRNDSFVTFTIIAGFLSNEEGMPFLCIRNNLRGARHLLTTGSEHGRGI